MITGISSMATRQVLAELAEAYERQAGVKVKLESVGGVDAAKRVQAGETFDFVVLAADAIERLASSGHVDPATRTDIVRSGIAVAVAAGTPLPAVDTEGAVREAVEKARSVGYSTGPSGTHLVRLFERWGVTTRLVQAPPGVPVGKLVAEGEVELGFQQLSELMHLPGIEVITDLAPQVQLVTMFSGVVCASSKQQPHAAAFLAFLGSPAAEPAKRRHGMEPA